MRISTLLSVLLSLGLCTIEEKKDFSLKLVLMTGRLILHALIYLASICIYFGIEILDHNEWLRDDVIIFIFKGLALTAVPVQFGLSSHGLRSIKILLEKHSHIQFPMSMFFFSLLIAFSYYFGLIPLELNRLLAPKTWKETYKSIAFMILIVQNGFALMTCLFVKDISIEIATDVAKKSLRHENLDIEDVDDVMTTWKVVSSGLDTSLFVYVIYTQLLLILALYTFVQYPNINHISLLIAAGSTFLLMFVTCYRLENLYTKFKILSTKAHEQALEGIPSPTIIR